MERTALIVDDDENIHVAFEEFLKSLGWRSAFASSVTEAKKRIAADQSFDLVFLDQCLGDGEGTGLIASIKERSPDVQVVVITAFADVETAVEAMKLGADEYLTKPLVFETVEWVVRRVGQVANLYEERNRLRERLHRHESSLRIVTRSPAMRSLLDRVARVGVMDSSVIIQGESGVGKELVARELHLSSPRASRPFVAVNCAAFSDELLSSALFGHEKGAFTGAVKSATGCFEEAEGGTLFLDEVTEMSPRLQASVLRVLQEREFCRVGSYKAIPTDVRIVAASNADVKQRVADGLFREDLFFRLNVVPLEIPPLRQRPEDVPALLDTYLSRFNTQYGVAVGPFTPEAMRHLVAYRWPGNVRELINLVEYLIATKQEGAIAPDDLPPGNQGVTPGGGAILSPGLKAGGQTLHAFLDGCEEEYLDRLSATCAGNVTQMAKTAGISRQMMHVKIKRRAERRVN